MALWILPPKLDGWRCGYRPKFDLLLMKLWHLDAGDGAMSHTQLIERKIETLEDMATKVRMLILTGV